MRKNKTRTTYTTAQVRAHDLEPGDMIRVASQRHWIEVLDVVATYDEARRVSFAAREVDEDLWSGDVPLRTGEFLPYSLAWAHGETDARGCAGVALAHDGEYVVVRVLDLAHSRPGAPDDAWVIYPARDLVTVQLPERES